MDTSILYEYYFWFFIIGVILFVAFILVVELNSDFKTTGSIPGWTWIIFAFALFYLILSILAYWWSKHTMVVAADVVMPVEEILEIPTVVSAPIAEPIAEPIVESIEPPLRRSTRIPAIRRSSRMPLRSSRPFMEEPPMNEPFEPMRRSRPFMEESPMNESFEPMRRSRPFMEEPSMNEPFEPMRQSRPFMSEPLEPMGESLASLPSRRSPLRNGIARTSQLPFAYS